MINFARSTNVYKIWADMIAFGGTDLPVGEHFYCCLLYTSQLLHHGLQSGAGLLPGCGPAGARAAGFSANAPGALPLQPVSYTHLDVYKRQSLAPPAAANPHWQT